MLLFVSLEKLGTDISSLDGLVRPYYSVMIFSVNNIWRYGNDTGTLRLRNKIIQ